MKNIQFTTSPGIPRTTMDEEFLAHKKGSEWWYNTGYLNDESGRMFGFQFTLARVKVLGIRFYMLLTSITDFETGKHYYGQKTSFLGNSLTLTADKVAFGDVAELVFSENQVANKGHIELKMNDKNYSLAVHMDAVKSPVWHCEDGMLKMGLINEPKQRTYYYSYTNLASTGKLKLGDKEFNLAGKSWFDKQGGTYTITNRWVNWEWFSLRFFDNEEIMLFSFPQDNYRDGTFIDKSGKYRRLNNFIIEPLGFINAGGYKFSNGWKITIPGIKDEEYTVTPKINGQFNVFFFELLAEIKNKKGELVGYSVTELLPGVYNEKIKSSNAFKKV